MHPKFILLPLKVKRWWQYVCLVPFYTGAFLLLMATIVFVALPLIFIGQTMRLRRYSQKNPDYEFLQDRPIESIAVLRKN